MRLSRGAFVARAAALASLVAILSGCGVSCLYDEHGKVMVLDSRAQVTPERLVEVVDNALRPLGFAGGPWNPSTPSPQRYWDYEFRNPGNGGLFHRREPVEVRIKFDDLSIILVDWSRASDASEFDRRVMSAIQDQFRSELGAEITFSHPKPPAFCLGP